MMVERIAIVKVMICDLCHLAEATVIYEPNDPAARVEACEPCAKIRGYIK